MCFISSQSTSSNLFTDIKSFPKKILSTPLTNSKFLIKSLLVLSFFVTSKDPLIETVLPGKNFSELGFGVVLLFTIHTFLILHILINKIEQAQKVIRWVILEVLFYCCSIYQWL